MIESLLILFMAIVAWHCIKHILMRVREMCAHIPDMPTDRGQSLVDKAMQDAYSQAIWKARVIKFIRRIFK